MILPSSSYIALSPISSPPPTTLMHLRPRAELHKRNQVCGVLNDYPNAQAPVCSGTAPLCTFLSGRQGCCDESETCTFYTSCNGGLAESCTDPGCLQCPSTKPYCTRYEFDHGNSVYEGYGCGLVSLTEPVIHGSLGTQHIIATVTDSDASSASARSATATSQTSSATGTVISNSDSGEEGGGNGGLSVGGIVGAVIGAVAAIILIACLFICCRRSRRRSNMTGQRRVTTQLAQPVHRGANRASWES